MPWMRSAIPTICARLGRFMLTRYFSIISPSCFCAPAVTPPTLFITLENSGDAIAWLAKELNPFSISPIMVCQIMAGSLPLSAIGALHLTTSALPRLGYYAPYHTVVAGRSTGRLHTGCKAFCDAANRAIQVPIKVPSTARRTDRRDACPSAAQDRPCQRHRHLLRNFRGRRFGTAAADYGAGRPDDPLGR